MEIDCKNIIAMHMLTDIDTDREVSSMISLSKLENYGIQYITRINPRYTELPPSDTCEYPEKISIEPGGKLTPGHYGCYLAHKDAVLSGISSNPDYILIFECDAIIDVTYDEFIKKLKFSCETLNSTDLLMFSFGFHNNTNIIDKKDEYWIVNKFYGAHAYLIPRKSYDIFKHLFENEKWNVTDLLYAEKLDNFKIGIFETPITKQSAGFSILDKVYHEERH
jgi:GR25 family glycosyltransferase involved in LPS biosynthesis